MRGTATSNGDTLAGFFAKLTPLNTKLKSNFTKLRSLGTKLRSLHTSQKSLNTNLKSDFTKLRSLATKLRSDFTKLMSLGTKLRSNFTKPMSQARGGRGRPPHAPEAREAAVPPFQAPKYSSLSSRVKTIPAPGQDGDQPG